MAKGYEGPLGRFTYDEGAYGLKTDKDGKEFLAYVGSETDGSKIKIPDGITDITGMFQDTKITSQPAIPNGVRIADCAFAGCDNLEKAGPFPPGLESANHMYAHCEQLESCEKLPEGLLYGKGMFEGCKSLEELPEAPEFMKVNDRMFDGCGGHQDDRSIKGLSKPEKGVDGLQDVTQAQQDAASPVTASKAFAESLEGRAKDQGSIGFMKEDGTAFDPVKEDAPAKTPVKERELPFIDYSGHMDAGLNLGR